jgi:GNAT superfamily N-acetyltransferase
MRGIREHGLAGVCRRAATLTADRIWLDESHIWYRLDLGRTLPARPLPEGFTLVSGTLAEFDLLDQISPRGGDEARLRAADGGALWLVLEGRTVAFACWIFSGRAPTRAARGGWAVLPPRSVGLDFSVTSPLYRGRGLAPAAWDSIAATLAAEGVETMVTKVGVDNSPSRKAVEKAGFQAIATVRLRRLGPRSTVRVETDDGELGAYLGMLLER